MLAVEWVALEKERLHSRDHGMMEMKLQKGGKQLVVEWGVYTDPSQEAERFKVPTSFAC
jgi:hypothetical protein